MVTKLALEEIPDGPLLLDGFPRSVKQAIDLDESVEIDAVIDLDVPFDVIKVNIFFEILYLKTGPPAGIVSEYDILNILKETTS